MNRLAFRVWLKQSNVMVGNSDTYLSSYLVNANGNLCFFRPGDEILDDAEKWAVPMQSTGCIDRRGQTIYESDIVTYVVAVPILPRREDFADDLGAFDRAMIEAANAPHPQVEYQERRALVEWNGVGWFPFVGPAPVAPGQVDVIGNRYEHPELLQK